MSPALSIVIVTYNSAAVIRQCLDSISASFVGQREAGILPILPLTTTATDFVGQDGILPIPPINTTATENGDATTQASHLPPIETIVVDNGSTDGTPELIRQQFPWVRLFADHGNLLFAGGNNYGFKHATAPLILMLNPDTVIHPSALQVLVGFANAHPKAGMIAPHLVNPDGTLQHNVFHFPDLRQAIYGFFEKLAPIDSPQNGRYSPESYTHVHEVEHILGAALLFRRELYAQLPGMDEKFGIYFEETDWCYRARRAGWVVLYTPAATVTHLGAHSTGKNPEKSSAQFYKSQSYFYRKNYGLPAYIALKLITLIGLSYWLARTLWARLRGRIDSQKLGLRLWSYGEILRA